MSGNRKYSLSIAGHRTSLSLEPEFWEKLQSMATAEQRSVADLVASIDQSRGKCNLSSAVRVWVLQQAFSQL